MADVPQTYDTGSGALEVSGAVGGEHELAVGRSMAQSFAEIQGAIVLARRFPRDHDTFYQKLMTACQRKSFAEAARYSFPRAGTNITGPSVNLAREAGKLYANLRWGLDVLRDDGETVTIEGWAWDVETNVKAAYQDQFRKLIQRKDKRSGQTRWEIPDERDLRELIFRRGAILVRNAILNVIPRDAVDDALAECARTITKNIQSIAEFKKGMLRWFAKHGVTAKQLNRFVGGEDWTEEDCADIQAVANAIKDGAAKPSDYFKKDDQGDPDPEGGGDDDVPARATNGSSKKSKSEQLADDLGNDDDEPKEQPKSAEKADGNGDMSKLVDEIVDLERSKDLAGKSVLDARSEHAGAADFSKCTVKDVTKYRNYLKRLADKPA